MPALTSAAITAILGFTDGGMGSSSSGNHISNIAACVFAISCGSTAGAVGMAISPVRGQPKQTVGIVAIVVKFSLATPAVGMNMAPVSPRLRTCSDDAQSVGSRSDPRRRSRRILER
jgi:hypothetical protein